MIDGKRERERQRSERRRRATGVLPRPWFNPVVLVCPVCGIQKTMRYKFRHRKYCSKICANNAPKPRHFGYQKPGYDPTECPDSLVVAWAAGIYEGEGSANRHGNCARVHIAQKDSWILEQLVRYWGGRVANYQGYHHWQISGSRARGFLSSIYGYLSPRRQEQVRRAQEID